MLKRGAGRKVACRERRPAVTQKQVCVQLHTSADNMTLLAFAATGRTAAINGYRLPRDLAECWRRQMEHRIRTVI